MARFFETFEVVKGDGPWSANPYPVDTLSGGISVQNIDICAPYANPYEVQLITIGGSPTGGTFTLAFESQVTSTLAYNAAASAVQTALRGLSTIGAGNVTVTGSNGGPYTVTFIGSLANLQLPAIVINITGLTGGTPTGAVAITTPGNIVPLNSYPLTIDATPFAIEANGIIPPRCAPEYYGQFITEALDFSAEYQVSNALWYGYQGITGTMYMENPAVQVLSRTGDPYTLVGAVLQAAYQKTPFLQPVIHLGWQSAMALQLGLASLQLPFVVPHGYPANAIAVTGPVKVRLGSIQTITRTDYLLNRTYYESTRLASIEFDPGVAVRVADS